VYCTLLPLCEHGAVPLPAAVAGFMDKLAAETAVKAGTEAVSSRQQQQQREPLLTAEAAVKASTDATTDKAAVALQNCSVHPC
jgi:hypothetical protein